jgi:hypothetical protein
VPYSFFFRELDFFEALLALFVSDALGIGTVKRVTVASGKTAVALREAVARGDRDTYVRPANAGALLKAH